VTLLHGRLLCLIVPGLLLVRGGGLLWLMLCVMCLCECDRIQRCCTIMGRKDTDDMSAAQVMYPCMQCADIFFLKVGRLVMDSHSCYRMTASRMQTRGCLM
jgi:hypothetical protein